MTTQKPFASFDDQINRMKNRGLILPDDGTVEQFLKRNSYYRFSGYMRYFQLAPGKGDENFRQGTKWEDIVTIYELDVSLRSYLLAGLQIAEIATRTAFAHCEAENHSPYGHYLNKNSYVEPKRSNKKPKRSKQISTEKIIRSELDRSKEPFIKRYRPQNTNGTQWMDNVPVWAAVEVLSFGTLSKAIAYQNDDQGLYKAMCSILGVQKEHLAPQLRSFTHARNRCAHFSRIWNCFIQNQPKVSSSVKKRAIKLVGEYNDNSMLSILVALDDFLFKTNAKTNFLEGYIELTADSRLFQKGIAKPYKK